MEENGKIRDLNTPLWQYTAGEFAELMYALLRRAAADAMAAQPQPVAPPPPADPGPRYVRGLKNLAEALQVSINTLEKWRRAGILDGAITQCGRVITADVEMARELLRQHDAKRRARRG